MSSLFFKKEILHSSLLLHKNFLNKNEGADKMVDFINLEINKKEIIYDGKVKMTYGGQGIIRFKDKMLGKRVYVIFPMYRKNTEEGVIVAVDEILNKGIHPENDHSSGIPLGQKYVGRKCIAILQEG